MAMNGCIRRRVISKPFANPNAVAARSDTTSAAGRGHPSRTKVRAKRVADSASMDPTERSIPAVMMTRVMPTARMPISEI